MATTNKSTGETSSPKSGAIDLIQQSQQGFAKLESEAKAVIAERHGNTKVDEAPKQAVEAKAEDGTKVTAKDRPAAAAKHPANDDEASNAAARVTALYLANGDSDAPAKHAA